MLTDTAKAPTKPQLKNRAIVAHALKKAAEKLANNSARDLLTAGASHQVDFSIIARVNGRLQPPLELNGRLNVGHDTTTNSSVNADPAHVLALALAELSESRRRVFLAELPRLFSKRNGLPEVADEIKQQATELFEQLRHREAKEKRGSVSFTRTDAA